MEELCESNHMSQICTFTSDLITAREQETVASELAEIACHFSHRFDLMKYCRMWNFKDRPAYSAIIKLLESYIHLADTEPLRAIQCMDISEYRRKAGVPP